MRPTLVVGALLVVLTALVAPSCGGGDPADSSAFADQYCDLINDCCAQAKLSTDGTTCRAWIAIAAGSGKYDAASGGACIKAVTAAKQSADFCTAGTGINSAACSTVFQSGGSVAPGGTCSKSSDCAASSAGAVTCFEVYSSSGETRTCMVLMIGGVGDKPCVGTKDGSTYFESWSSTQGAAPATGFLCDRAGGSACDHATTTCMTLKNLGDDCNESGQCMSSAYCDFATSKCVARLAVGAACASFSDCVSGAYCDSAASKCAATADVGAACTSSEQCGSGSCVNKVCGAAGGLSLVCGTGS